MGVDQFDCVYPSRTARFGTALVQEGTIKLKQAKYEYDFNPLDSTVPCYVDKNYTRAFFNTVVQKEEVLPN